MKYSLLIAILVLSTLGFSIVRADDSPPVVANPISPVVVTENSVATVIDLSTVFSDPEGYVISLSILGNTNASLVTPTLAGSILTLTYTPNQTGTAELTIRATADGETADTSFNITVNPVVAIPIFGPVGLLLSIFGLLWLGTKRRKI